MIRFSYQLEEHGWASASITDDVSHLDLRPTLIFTDPLAELARACVALLDTLNSPYLTPLACAWPDEPGEWRWLLEKQGTDLRIRILRFDDWPPSQPHEAGELAFITICSLLKFAIQVQTQLRDIRSALGADEYRRRTYHPFPEAQLEKLTNSIRAEQATKKKSRESIH
ncbi:MAG TPA: hypothetical protein VKY74_27250 [Chloroflexia bacterium]|nr:hypothetical protein [Chloroflexia bacterium]